jgi:hypothetical protein
VWWSIKLSYRTLKANSIAQIDSKVAEMWQMGFLTGFSDRRKLLKKMVRGGGNEPSTHGFSGQDKDDE